MDVNGVFGLGGREMKSGRFAMFSTKIQIAGIVEIINHEYKVKHCSHSITHHKESDHNEFEALYTIRSSYNSRSSSSSLTYISGPSSIYNH